MLEELKAASNEVGLKKKHKENQVYESEWGELTLDRRPNHRKNRQICILRSRNKAGQRRSDGRDRQKG